MQTADKAIAIATELSEVFKRHQLSYIETLQIVSILLDSTVSGAIAKLATLTPVEIDNGFKN